MSATDRDPGFIPSGVSETDYKELRSTMSDLVSNLARMEGKIDTQTILLEKVSSRQDRSEVKIEEVEREFRTEIRRIEEKQAASINHIETKSAAAIKVIEERSAADRKLLWMGMGGITFATFFIGLAVSVWKLIAA